MHARGLPLVPNMKEYGILVVVGLIETADIDSSVEQSRSRLDVARCSTGEAITVGWLAGWWVACAACRCMLE